MDTLGYAIPAFATAKFKPPNLGSSDLMFHIARYSISKNACFQNTREVAEVDDISKRDHSRNCFAEQKKVSAPFCLKEQMVQKGTRKMELPVTRISSDVGTSKSLNLAYSLWASHTAWKCDRVRKRNHG